MSRQVLALGMTLVVAASLFSQRSVAGLAIQKNVRHQAVLVSVDSRGERDLAKLATALVLVVGFNGDDIHKLVGSQATSVAIESSIRAALAKSRELDHVFVFVAGGVQEGPEGEPLVLADGYQMGEPWTAFSLRSIWREMYQQRSKSSWWVIPSCGSDPFQREMHDILVSKAARGPQDVTFAYCAESAPHRLATEFASSIEQAATSAAAALSPESVLQQLQIAGGTRFSVRLIPRDLNSNPRAAMNLRPDRARVYGAVQGLRAATEPKTIASSIENVVRLAKEVSDRSVSIEVAELLGDLAADENLPDSVRVFAVRGIGDLPSDIAAPKLTQVFDAATAPVVQEAAVAASGELGAAGTILVGRALDSDARRLRAAGVNALVRSGQPDGLERILALFDHEEDPTVVSSAVRAVGQLAGGEKSDARRSAMQALALNALLQLLRNEHSRVRIEAVIAAAGFTSQADALADSLLDLMRSDDHGEIREAAAYALGRLAPEYNAEIRKTVADAFATTAVNASRDEAVSALWGLAASGANEHWKIAERILVDSRESVLRRAAAEALGGLKEHRAIPVLRTIAASEDEDVNLRIEALYALGDIGGPEAISGLLAAGRSPNGGVGSAAWEALGRISEFSAELAELALDSQQPTERRLRATEVLGRSADQDALGPLLHLSQDGDDRVRQTAVAGLKQLVHTDVREKLIRDFSSTENPAEQAVLAKVLGFVPELQILVLEGVEQRPVEYRLAVAEAVTGPDVESPALLKMVDLSRDADARVRATAARSLGTNPSELARDRLMDIAAKDDSAQVRAVATDALRGHLSLKREHP